MDLLAVGDGGKKAKSHSNDKSDKETQPLTEHPSHWNSIRDETRGG